MNTTAIYTEGQTIKITPTSTNPYNLNGRTLTVTVSWIKDENVMRVELSPEDAEALKLRAGRTEITIDVNAKYADWAIETIEEAAPVVADAPLMLSANEVQQIREAVMFAGGLSRAFFNITDSGRVSGMLIEKLLKAGVIEKNPDAKHSAREKYRLTEAGFARCVKAGFIQQ